MNLFWRRFKRRTRRLITFCICVALIGGGYLFRGKVIEQYNHAKAYYFVWKGDEAYKQNDLQKAIDKYNIAINLYPEHVKALYNLANIYVSYEDYSQAVEYYQKALVFSPNFLNARVNLALILAQNLVDLDRAIEEDKKAINADIRIIKLPFIYNNEDYVKTGKSVAYYNMALAYRMKSLQAEPGSYEATRYLLLAETAYKKSLEIKPDVYDAVYNLALTLHLLNKDDDALKFYCHAINMSPLDYEVHYNMALLLRKKSLYWESIAELKKAGQLLDVNGDGVRSRYIYQVLNEIYRYFYVVKNVDGSWYFSDKNGFQYDKNGQKYDLEHKNANDAVYVDGVVKSAEQAEKEFIENMKTCKLCQDMEKEKTE